MTERDGTGFGRGLLEASVRRKAWRIPGWTFGSIRYDDNRPSADVIYVKDGTVGPGLLRAALVVDIGAMDEAATQGRHSEAAAALDAKHAAFRGYCADLIAQNAAQDVREAGW